MDELDEKPPSVAVDIHSPHIKGADVLSVGASKAFVRKLKAGGRMIRIEGEETRVEAWFDADAVARLAAALIGLKVEVVEATNQPTTCKVWRDGVLIFDGQDKSALLREPR